MSKRRTQEDIIEEEEEDEIEEDEDEEMEEDEDDDEDEGDEDEIDVDDNIQNADSILKPLVPSFPALNAVQMAGGSTEIRKIPVPAHRYTPLKTHWLDIYTPIVEHMKLQIRMNTHTRQVEIKTSEFTVESGALQKACDFVRAFILGFDVQDAIALLRLDDLYIDSFEIQDVKTLSGDNLSRAIGRISGKDGKTKFTIENATRTRIVIADKHIHILGSFANIKIARDSICSLILGSPPGKVYAKLKTISARIKERF